jgi:hypothetical protein
MEDRCVMTGRTDWTSASLGGSFAVLKLAAAVALFAAAPALGQDLPLPVPQFSATPSNQRVAVSWTEVATDAGRRAQIDTLLNWGSDPDTLVILGGEYVGSCDFRVFLQRLPVDNGFNRQVRVTGRLFDQEQAVGAPLAIDTLVFTDPYVPVPFASNVAPFVDLQFASNIGAASPLGSIPVTVEGLNTNIARSSTYIATALNSVADFPLTSDSLVVKVVGPTTENDSTLIPPQFQFSDTLVVRSTNDVFPIFNGMRIRFGAGSTAAGDSSGWAANWVIPTTGIVQIDLEAFEGYRVWRSETPELDSFALIGEVLNCSGLTNLGDIDYDSATRTFTFTDTNVNNDFPFRYAVATFDRGFLGNEFNLVYDGARTPTDKLYPGRSVRDESQEVYVVPNPYIRHADWEEGEPKVVFTNLPESCTIRVFTEAADHLATIQHGPNEPNSTSPTTVSWNLKSESGRDIVPGVYIYYVEGPSFQQMGKMMVAR